MQRFPLSAFQVRVQNQGPFFFAIGMVIGAAWYFSIDFEPSFWGGAAIAMSLLILLLWARRQVLPNTLFAFLTLICGVTVGAFSGSAAVQRTPAHTIQSEMGPVLLEGWVQNALPANRGTRLVIRVHAIDGLSRALTPNRVRLTHITALKTEPGRFVRCWAVLRPPPATVIAGDYQFDRQAWFEGLGAVGYVQGRCRGGAVGAPDGFAAHLRNWIATQRRQLAHHVRIASGERAGGFAAALASGDRSFMSRADQEALRGAGLAHLLAISGLHMGIVGGIVFLLIWRALSLIEPVALRIAVKKPAALCALLACATYLVISGASVSTQRAFIMAAVLFGAVLIDRTALSLRSLSIAMILIIFLAPWSVLTPGFQMSLAATGALIASYERWQRRRRSAPENRSRGVSFWIKSLVVTSTVSSFATMPFALFHFDRVAGLGLIANLMAMPIVSLVSAPAATAALVLAPFGLDGWALRVFGASLELILVVAHTSSNVLPDRQVSMAPMPAMSLILFSAAIIGFCLQRSSRGALAIALAFGLVATLIWGNAGADRLHWAPSGALYLEHASGAIEMHELRNGEGLGPLRYSDHLPDTRCETGTNCAYHFKDKTILYLGAPQDVSLAEFEAADLLLVTEQMPELAGAHRVEALYWTQIQRENGITLNLNHGTFKKRLKPSCNSRPWRQCRNEE